MRDAPKSDAFCAHWIALPARNNLRDHAPDEPPVVIELRAGDEPVTVTAKNGSVRVRPGAAENPDAIVSGRRDWSMPFSRAKWISRVRAPRNRIHGRCEGFVPSAAACGSPKNATPNETTKSRTAARERCHYCRQFVACWQTPAIILACGCLIGVLGFGAHTGLGFLPHANVA